MTKINASRVKLYKFPGNFHMENLLTTDNEVFIILVAFTMGYFIYMCM